MNPSVPKSEYLNWTGEFYCDNLAFDHYEILMINGIPKKERKSETELMTTKWFDYRLMHPMYATYYFYHLYVKEFQAFWRKAINFEAAEFIYPFKGDGRLDFMKAREKLSIWRLRQKADLLGIRYDFFLKTAFNKIHRMQAGGRIIPPRPAMFNNEELLAEIVNEWSAMCKASLQFACSPYFQVINFNNSLIQREHEQFVMRQVEQRTIPYYSLSSCLHQYEIVSIEAALQRFEPQTVQLAINESVAY